MKITVQKTAIQVLKMKNYYSRIKIMMMIDQNSRKKVNIPKLKIQKC